jgi:ABC-type bacteriocin/lantibiotic exporter with double-glycine peptidase domain
VISVTHRPESIALADQIVVMRRGRIAEMQPSVGVSPAPRM